jgi:hypothetical protein
MGLASRTEADICDHPNIEPSDLVRMEPSRQAEYTRYATADSDEARACAKLRNRGEGNLSPLWDPSREVG